MGGRREGDSNSGGGAERICQVSGFLEFALYASGFITCVYLTPCRLFCFQPALPTLTAHAHCPRYALHPDPGHGPQGRRGMKGAVAQQFARAAARGWKEDLTSDCCSSRDVRFSRQRPTFVSPVSSPPHRAPSCRTSPPNLQPLPPPPPFWKIDETQSYLQDLKRRRSLPPASNCATKLP